MSNEQNLRHALKVTSAWLAALARTSTIDDKKRTIIRNPNNGVIIAELSISEALDLANEALEEAEPVP